MSDLPQLRADAQVEQYHTRPKLTRNELAAAAAAAAAAFGEVAQDAERLGQAIAETRVGIHKRAGEIAQDVARLGQGLAEMRADIHKTLATPPPSILSSEPARKRRGRDIPTATFHTESSMPIPQSDHPPSWSKLELEAIKPLRQIEELTSLDRDTLVRVYPQYLVRLSPKRLGMKFRNVLKIINGDATAA
jgi:hypothetical protein